MIYFGTSVLRPSGVLPPPTQISPRVTFLWTWRYSTMCPPPWMVDIFFRTPVFESPSGFHSPIPLECKIRWHMSPLAWTAQICSGSWLFRSSLTSFNYFILDCYTSGPLYLLTHMLPFPMVNINSTLQEFGSSTNSTTQIFRSLAAPDFTMYWHASSGNQRPRSTPNFISSMISLTHFLLNLRVPLFQIFRSFATCPSQHQRLGWVMDVGTLAYFHSTHLKSSRVPWLWTSRSTTTCQPWWWMVPIHFGTSAKSLLMCTYKRLYSMHFTLIGQLSIIYT